MVMQAHKINVQQEITRIDGFKWTNVSLSEVFDQNLRLDANVYGLDGKIARETLADCRWEVVNLKSNDGLIESVWYPTRFKRIYVERGGLPFFLPSQLNEVNPKPSKFISGKTPTSFELIKAKRNQLLLTRSGTIGNCTIVTSTLEGKLFSDDVIRITFKNLYDLGYTYAFFKTQIGQTLIHTNNYGAVIRHIEPEHLAEIPIPNPPPIIKTQIHNLVMDSFALRDESNELIERAEQLLFHELNLPPINEINAELFEPETSFNNFTVNLSELNERLEGSFHNPLAKAIVSIIEKNAFEVTTVKDERIAAKILLPTRFKRVYVENGFGIPFFSGKQIYELNPSNKEYLSFAKHSNKIKQDLTIRENMVLVTCSGTIGKVTLVPKHWDGWAMTHDIIRLIPQNNNIAGYLYVWLSSDYGKELLNRFVYGAVVGHIESHHIAKVEIPLLKNENTQKEINDLALEANRKRYDAFLLEEEAIKLVNEKVIYSQ